MRRERIGALLVALVLATRPAAAQSFGSPQNVTVVDSGTACTTAPTACATFALDSVSASVALGVSGTWTGTLTFEGTNDGSTWTTIQATNVATGVPTTTTTANGLFSVGNGGVISVRLRATAAITGTAVVKAARGSGSAAKASSSGTFSGDVTSGGEFYASNGSAGVPSYSFTSEPTKGLYSFGAGAIGISGSLEVTGAVRTTTNFISNIGFYPTTSARTGITAPTDGSIAFINNAGGIGVTFKADALPTVSACGAGAPAVTAPSTPLFGQVTVGTGAPATCLITFNGTAYPQTASCTANVATSTAANVRAIGALGSTTTLTLVPATAFVDGSIVNWHCGSGK